MGIWRDIAFRLSHALFCHAMDALLRKKVFTLGLLEVWMKVSSVWDFT